MCWAKTSVPLASSGIPAGAITVPLRADAREPLSYRDVVLETGVSLGTLGSAKVVVGGPGGYTEVWAGVKGEVENVEQSAEDASAGAGKVVVSVEWSVRAVLGRGVAHVANNVLDAAHQPH